MVCGLCLFQPRWCLLSSSFQLSHVGIYSACPLLCVPLSMAVLWGAAILTCYRKWWGTNFIYIFLYLVLGLESAMIFSTEGMKIFLPRGKDSSKAPANRPSFVYHYICICFICMHTMQTSANVPRFNEIWWSTFLTLQYYSTFIGKWAKPVIHAV